MLTCILYTSILYCVCSICLDNLSICVCVRHTFSCNIYYYLYCIVNVYCYNVLILKHLHTIWCVCLVVLWCLYYLSVYYVLHCVCPTPAQVTKNNLHCQVLLACNYYTSVVFECFVYLIIY